MSKTLGIRFIDGLDRFLKREALFLGFLSAALQCAVAWSFIKSLYTQLWWAVGPDECESLLYESA